MAQHRTSPERLEWLGSVPLATGVISGGKLVDGNAALLEILDARREDLGGDVFEFVALEDRDRVRDRYARRVRGEAVPDSYEFVLVSKRGERKLVEIFVARPMERDRLVFQLADRTARNERLRQLRALARLGASVQMYQSDDAVFAATSAGLTELGITWIRVTPDGDGVRVVALSVPDEGLAEFERVTGRAVVGSIGRWVPGTSKAWSEGVSFIDDAALSTSAFFADEHASLAGALMRQFELTRAAVLRIDSAGQPSEMLIVLAPWIAPEDVPAFALFATQVSAALDAARVIDDLSQRNAELAALNRIALATGSERGLEELFSVGAEEATRVLGCATFVIYLLDDSGKTATMAFERGVTDEARARFARVPLEGSPMTDVVRVGRTQLWIKDELEPELRGALERRQLGSVAAVPLVVRAATVGVLTVGFARVVTEREVNVLEAVSAHFAASLEAKRLFDTLRSSYATLARTQQQLVHRERLAAIGELSAVVAHEVRNPLGVIFNSVGAIRRMLKDVPDAKTIVDILEEEASRLNHIVGDLLDFARPATPTLHAERIESVLDAAAESALGESRGGVEVVREYQADLPHVRVDSRLMRQAFLNLVLNAIQAMPHGGRLTLKLVDMGSGVRVEIGDTGVGIPADVRARIFEPFFTTRATGTGLGLAVVKRIVDGHRGEIEVATAHAKGTTFAVLLPLDPDEAPSVDSASLA